jgi:hypothetical protein
LTSDKLAGLNGNHAAQLEIEVVLTSHRMTTARFSPCGNDKSVMKQNYIAERVTLGAVDGGYPAVRNILKQPAIMA